MTNHRLLLPIIALVGALASAPPAQAGPPPQPDSISAIGDSITQAFDVCCWYGNHPRHSWSTGDDPSDAIASHYERIAAVNPAILGHAHNDAVSGADMADADGQAEQAVSQGADYVTILMGANDVCTSSRETMTPVKQFRHEFKAAMTTLEEGLPAGAHIFVASIPNIYRLWKILHTNPLAEAVWYSAQICQSMLSPFNTPADRRAVLSREKRFNVVLGSVCGAFSNCKFDQLAVFQYRLSTDDVSTLDYFHPSLRGQAALAKVTWAASWWPSGR
jgi:lysophospholipase L1-like esterase